MKCLRIVSKYVFWSVAVFGGFGVSIFATIFAGVWIQKTLGWPDITSLCIAMFLFSIQAGVLLGAVKCWEQR